MLENFDANSLGSGKIRQITIDEKIDGSTYYVSGFLMVGTSF